VVHTLRSDMSVSLLLMVLRSHESVHSVLINSETERRYGKLSQNDGNRDKLSVLSVRFAQ